MKTKFLVLAIILLFQNLFSQEIVGSWKGELAVQGVNLPLILHIEKDGTNYKSTFDSPMQGAKGIPIESTTFTNNELKIGAPNLGISYSGKLLGDKIDGNFSQTGFNAPLTLEKLKSVEPELNRPQTPKPPFSYNTQDVTFKNETEGNVLVGTISTPKDLKNFPILVMITGSGAQNRDEELFGHKTFAVIADDFAKKGIATLRIDDRGIGGSEKGKSGSTSQDFAGDISSAVNFLVAQGYKNIGLIGHSEGGMIAPMVANQNKNVKFMVLMAGPGIPIVDLMLKQSNDIGKISGVTEDAMKKNQEISEKIYNFVTSYKGNQLKNDLNSFIETELKKADNKSLSIAEIDKKVKEQTEIITNPWFLYFIKFNPENYLSKVKIPVLAINGSLDLQVSAKENLAGIKKSLEKAGNKNFEVVELPSLNHLFQTAKTGNPNEYGVIEETIAPKALNIMTDWIKKLK